MDKRMSSLELTDQDIKAIANGRVNRQYKPYFYAVLVIVAIGIAIDQLIINGQLALSKSVGLWALMIAGLIILLFEYWLSSKREHARTELLNLWSREISK